MLDTQYSVLKGGDFICETKMLLLEYLNQTSARFQNYEMIEFKLVSKGRFMVECKYRACHEFVKFIDMERMMKVLFVRVLHDERWRQ